MNSQYNRKHLHTIMNVDGQLDNEHEVVSIALEFVARMCDPEVLHTNAMFYVTTDDDGKIALGMDS